MSNLDDGFTTTPKGEPAKTNEVTSSSYDKASWAEQKQQERDQAYKMIDATAEQIANDGSKLKGYLDVQSHFDRYSVANTLLILAQKPDATKLGDFNTWKEKDVFVKKGETGIIILEPGEEYTRDDGSIGVSYNTKKIFDVTQTNFNQIANPEIKKDDRLLLKALMNNSPAQINGSDQLPGNAGAVYNAETKEILVRKGMNGTDTFRALSQELSHAEMDKPGYKRNDCALQAYCASYILCKRNGLDVSSFSFDQFPSYYKDMDVKAVRSDLSKIRDVANAISSRMAKVLDLRTPNRQKDEQSR